MIQPGQIYRSCDPRGGPRIRIERYTPGDARAHIVDALTGKRFRQILVKDLHESPVTATGRRRRSGYVLDRHTPEAPQEDPSAPRSVPQPSGGELAGWNGDRGAQAASGGSDVQGRCPACGGASLFLADGGYITCRRLDCPQPDAATEVIADFWQARQHAGFTFCPQNIGHVTMTEFGKKITEKVTAVAQRAEAVRYANEQKQHAEKAETALARVHHLADLIAAGAPWTANRDDLAQRIREAASVDGERTATEATEGQETP